MSAKGGSSFEVNWLNIALAAFLFGSGLVFLVVDVASKHSMGYPIDLGSSALVVAITQAAGWIILAFGRKPGEVSPEKSKPDSYDWFVQVANLLVLLGGIYLFIEAFHLVKYKSTLIPVQSAETIVNWSVLFSVWGSFGALIGGMYTTWFSRDLWSSVKDGNLLKARLIAIIILPTGFLLGFVILPLIGLLSLFPIYVLVSLTLFVLQLLGLRL